MQKIIFYNNISADNYNDNSFGTEGKENEGNTPNRIAILHSLTEQINHLIKKEKRVFILADKKLKDYYKLFGGAEIIEIECSEQNKTLSTVEIIIEKLLKSEADRETLLIGFGGGITTDICGFTGSIYKRGIRFASIPTTLLAQCDAAIGGKNGVNFGTLKNIIGTITTPQWILISPLFLKTLPDRELRNGFAEIVKTFIIFDQKAYSDAIELFSRLNKKMVSGKKIDLQEVEIEKIVEKCSNFKLSIVEKDLYETGERRVLNLGHTFAHAIESCLRENKTECRGTGLVTDISHGEAVAIGIIYAAKIAERLGLAEENLAGKLESDFCSAGLPTSAAQLSLSPQKIFEAITNDKKREGDKIHLILPKSIGNVLDVPIEIDKLQEIANDLCKFK